MSSIAEPEHGRGSQLIDQMAVRDVQIRYALALDDRRFDELGSVFTADAVAEYRGMATHHGLGRIERACRRSLVHLDGTQHVITNFWCDVSGDSAAAGCYFTAHHVRGPVRFTAGGHYRDTLVRTEVGWRISHRVAAVVWTDGDPAVLEPGSDRGAEIEGCHGG